jgi:hypothetical protein
MSTDLTPTTPEQDAAMAIIQIVRNYAEHGGSPLIQKAQANYAGRRQKDEPIWEWFIDIWGPDPKRNLKSFISSNPEGPIKIRVKKPQRHRILTVDVIYAPEIVPFTLMTIEAEPGREKIQAQEAINAIISFIGSRTRM